jgi:hypothetical protein
MADTVLSVWRESRTGEENGMATLKASKGFFAAGWKLALPGATPNVGASLGVFVFEPRTSFGNTPLPTYRIRVGKRKVILERRDHGTPTGRCSVGRWTRVDDAPTPRKAGDWTRLGKFWNWLIEENVAALLPDYSWTADKGKDPNRCRPPIGKGRGRKLRALPKKDDLIDAPANGRRCATQHGPRHPKAAPKRPAPTPSPNRREALAKARRRDVLGAPGERVMVSATYTKAADRARAEIAAHAAAVKAAAQK